MNNIDFLLDSAFKDYNSGEYGSAEQKTREALMLSPTHGDALYLLGLIAYKKGVWTEAMDLLSLVVKIYPDYSNYRLALAEVYQNHGDYDKAEELYLTEKKNPHAMAEIGWIELKKGNHKKAKEIFKKNPVARSFLGLSDLNKGKQKLMYLKKAFEIDPSDFTARALALYYLDKNEYKQAKPYVEKLSKDKFIQALWLRQHHQETKALELLKQLTMENTFLWEPWFELAKTAEQISDIMLAESAYRRVLDLKTNSFDAAKSLARLLMKEGRLSEAIDIYQKLVRDNPQDKEILLAVATILSELNEPLEALGIYFNLISLGQKGLSKTIEEQILKLSKTDKETALRFAKGWIKHFPKNKSAQKVFKMLKVFLILTCLWNGITFAQMPVPDQDLNFLWQAKMADYGDPTGQYELGKIYEQGKGVPKNLAKAIHYYQLSAQQDYLPSAMELGRIFANEKVVYDEKKSIEWYTFAANRGEIQAENYLFHYYDELDPPEKQKAFYWLEKMLKEIFPKEKDLGRFSADYERLKKELEEEKS